MMRMVWIALLIPWLVACDRLAERAGMPDPAKVEAEGKAIGAACRDSGRGLEECFQLNDGASKAAIYAGWKEMNEYMMQNNMRSTPPGSGTGGGKAAQSDKSGAGDAAADHGDKKDKTDKKAPDAHG
jgi:hypothetical protein